MMRVAVRELKARLSEYLSRVKAGDEVVVTERGRSVAKLVPMSPDEAQPDRMLELEKRGLLRRGSGKLPEGLLEHRPVLDPEGLAVKALLADRDEGL
jgi:prevent-host-death family protein